VNDRGRRERVERLFEAALDVPRADRQAFVRDAGEADEAALARDVMALLAAHERADGILDERSSPERYGPYRILHELGRGGMGVVYLAVREDAFMRRVAPKVLRGERWAPAALARFDAERRIMAALDHPNVAQLLDGGVTADGRPCLALEYVEGLPLTTYCERGGLEIGERGIGRPGRSSVPTCLRTSWSGSSRETDLRTALRTRCPHGPFSSAGSIESMPSSRTRSCVRAC